MKYTKYLLPLILVLAVVACVKEPLGLYPDVGVVVVTSDSVRVNFNVPDSDPDTMSPGWEPGYAGSATKNMTVILKETAKKNVHVESLHWQIFDINGDLVGSDNNEYVPPIEIKGGQDTTFTITVEVWEGWANDLDDADDPADDYSGIGTIKFYVDGYDLQRGEDINCVPSYTPMSVSQ
jgi:hypothetical protein